MQYSIEKGELRGAGKNWVLDITYRDGYWDYVQDETFTAGVDVFKVGYTFTGPGYKTFYTGNLIPPVLPKATISDLSANGNSSQTTTLLTFYISSEGDGLGAVGALTSDNIILTGLAGITKGMLSVPGPLQFGRRMYTLPITVSGETYGGQLAVGLSVEGWDTGKPGITTVYYNYGDITYTGFVGKGYNVLKSPYYESSHIKQSALNMKAIIGKSGYYVKDTESFRDTKTSYVVGETMSEYAEQMSSHVGASGRIGLFSASVSVDYSSSSSMSSNDSFAKCISTLIKTKEYLDNAPLADLRAEYLEDNFKTNWLMNNSKTPDEVFNEYGTHILLAAYLGGRMDMSYQYHNESHESASQIEVKIRASYAFASGNADYSKEQTAKSFSSNSTYTISTQGGSVGLNLTNLENAALNYGSWASSVEDTSKNSLIKAGNFDKTSEIIPIWELIDPNWSGGTARKNAFITEYNKQLDANGGYILGMQAARKPYVSRIYLDAASTDNMAVANIKNMASPAAPIMITGNFNHGTRNSIIRAGFIATDNENQAIRDLTVINSGYAETPNSKVINGKNYILVGRVNYIPSLWLYSTTDPSAGAPIKGLFLEIDGNLANRDGETGWVRVGLSGSTSGANLNVELDGSTGDKPVIYLQMKR